MPKEKTENKEKNSNPPEFTIKTVIVGILSVASAVFSCWAIVRFGKIEELKTGEIISCSLWLVASSVLNASLWSLLSLARLKIKSYIILTTAIWLAASTSFYIFSQRDNFIPPLLGLTYSIIGLYFLVTTRNLLEEFVKFRPLRVYPRVARHTFLAIALLTSINFYFNYREKIKNSGFVIPTQLIRTLIEPSIKIAEDQAGKQINNLIGKQLESKLGVSGEEEILKFMQQESIETLEEGANARVGLGITPENLGLDKISISGGSLNLSSAFSSFYDNMIESAQKRINDYIEIIAPVVTLLLFSIIYFFDTIGAYILGGFLTGCFWILEQAGILKKVTELKEVTRLEL